jgi:DNA-binding transcriptional MerR regulator
MFTAATSSWTLDELAAEAQRLLQRHGLFGLQPDARVSAAPDARTVRYYTTLGLLDRPGYEGREARYARRHLIQLVAIKSLQAQGLSLAEVQSRLYGRTELELASFAEALAAEAAQARAQIKLPAVAFRTVREVQLFPGVKLVVEDGQVPSDPAGLEQKIRAALAALSSAPRGAGGKP